MNQKTRVLSGIRPTGELHLGNYFGAICQFLTQQSDRSKECFYFVADLHALTTANGPFALHQHSETTARSYLACGLDPDQSVLYKQSDIPQIPYLATLLGMLAGENWLRKCTTFKDKAAKQEVVSLGLLSYPVLMGADILIVDANLVPVGHDQLQHLEMIRDLAQKVNHNFAPVLTLPEAGEMSVVRVPGLDGSGKMGKSDGNTIGLFEEPKAVKKKILSALTDSGPRPDGQMSPEMQNIYYLLKLCSSPETYAEYTELYQRGEPKFYGRLKQQLAADVEAILSPLRERYHSPGCSAAVAREVLAEGAKKVRPIAAETLARVQHAFEL